MLHTTDEKWVLSAFRCGRLHYLGSPSSRPLSGEYPGGLCAVACNGRRICYLTQQYGHGARMVNHLVTRVKRGTRKASIVLGHDNLKPTTIKAYRTLLPWLKKLYTLIVLPTG